MCAHKQTNLGILRYLFCIFLLFWVSFLVYTLASQMLQYETKIFSFLTLPHKYTQTYHPYPYKGCLGKREELHLFTTVICLDVDFGVLIIGSINHMNVHTSKNRQCISPYAYIYIKGKKNKRIKKKEEKWKRIQPKICC